MTTAPEPSRRGDAVRVLVAFAGVHGSTRSIAEHIAGRLEERGRVRTDVLPVEAVSDPGAYDVFVVGSAVHGMAWLPEARTFVLRNAGLLARRDVWLFSVGMPAALRGPWKALAPQESDHVVGDLIERLSPRDHRLFSGVIAPEHLPTTGRMRFRAMGLRYGDYRDWPSVDAWAEEIGRAVRDRPPQPDGPPTGGPGPRSGP
ncbi:flavodoxin domain-containing protein [Streptomyces griseus]|uniref:flavodoxin domain-containing protein n=1 Tax=Streptomyces griseus TaxID=1911 RepID=UPI00084003D4|nr:flavodoxin domain-containing protein [Streptomyces griseus]